MSSEVTRGLRLEVRGPDRMARETKTLLVAATRCRPEGLPIRHDRPGYAIGRCQDSFRGLSRPLVRFETEDWATPLLVLVGPASSLSRLIDRPESWGGRARVVSRSTGFPSTRMECEDHQ